MRAWIRTLALVSALTLVLAGCSKKSPSPSPDGSPSPAPIVPSEEVSQSPELSAEPVSETPEPQITPVPSPADAKVWEANEGVGVSVTSWSNDYRTGGNDYLSAEITLPALSGTIPDTVTSYYAQALETFQSKSEAVASEALEWYKDGSLTRICTLRQDFYLECNNGGFISVRRQESYDSGGMHPELTLLFENFRVLDGKLLMLDDFFSVPREEYSPVLLQEVHRQLEARSEDLYDDWKETSEFLFPYDSFCMTQGGLSLFYPEQSLGPYAVGTLRIDIPWTTIEDIWKLP